VIGYIQRGWPHDKNQAGMINCLPLFILSSFVPYYAVEVCPIIDENLYLP